MMSRRRRHEECRRGEGACEVVLGQTCGGPKKGRTVVLREWMYGSAERVVGENILAAWAVAALFLGLVINFWLTIGAKGDAMGLLVAGEGAVWPIKT